MPRMWWPRRLNAREASPMRASAGGRKRGAPWSKFIVLPWKSNAAPEAASCGSCQAPSSGTGSGGVETSVVFTGYDAARANFGGGNDNKALRRELAARGRAPCCSAGGLSQPTGESARALLARRRPRHHREDRRREAHRLARAELRSREPPRRERQPRARGDSEGAARRLYPA